MPSFKARFVGFGLRPTGFYRNRFTGGEKFAANIAKARAAPPPEPTAAARGKTAISSEQFQGRNVWTIAPKDREPSAHMLYWHGGGYAMGSPASYRSLTMRLAARTGLPVIVPRYRLAPEHPYPAQLEDAVRCLDALERQGLPPGRLVFAGDSAGGNLALRLALYCREHGRPSPQGLVLISPWVDVLARHDEADRQDAILRAAWIHQLRDAYVPAPLRGPGFASTAQARTEGLAPTLLQFASAEMLAREARALGHRMRAAGVSVSIDEAPGLWHDYQLYGGLVPEADGAIGRIAEFVGALAPGQ